MISAPNHLQPLNGNNMLSFSLLGFILVTMMSCSATKAVYRPSTADKQIEEKAQESTITTLDTIQWDVVSEEDVPPITINDTELMMDKRSSYNVAMFLPLQTNKSDIQSLIMNENSSANRFISFYAGALMALEDLEEEGVNLRVDVFDSQRDVNKVNRDLKSDAFQNVDAIIGPYGSSRNKEGLQQVAKFGKDNELTVISPWYASKTITEENPYFIQLRPNLDDHYRKMLAHAKQNFSDDEIVILGREQNTDERRRRADLSRIANLQDIHKELSDDEYTPDLQVYSVHTDSLLNAEMVYDSLFWQPGRKAIIIPYYSSADESFVYNSLRRMNGEKGFEPVHVYTMPMTYESDKIEFNLYRNLSMKICRSKFVDKSEDNVLTFERNYFNRYGAIPSDDAYQGYDVMKFVGDSLDEYGRNFQFFLEGTRQYLQSSFDIQPLVNQGRTDQMIDDRMKELDYFVNKHLDIIEFKDTTFERRN